MEPYWTDGQITIYHGDCLTDVGGWLDADVLVTDPPYGMAFVSSWTTRKRPILNDMDTTVRDEALRMWGDKPAAVFGTWKRPRPSNTIARLIWDKSDGTGPGMGDLGCAFGTADEEIYLLGDWSKHGPRQSNILRSHEAMGGTHGLVAQSGPPTPKPVYIMAKLILATDPHAIIGDPFMGTGATLCAAKVLGRRAIGVEIEEKYCRVAVQRLQQQVLTLEVAV